MPETNIDPLAAERNRPSAEVRHGPYQRELADVCANLIFTSPPYNIGSRMPR